MSAPSPLSLSRPKRAAAAATEKKIEASLAAEDAKIAEHIAPTSKKKKSEQAALPKLTLTYFNIEGVAEKVRFPVAAATRAHPQWILRRSCN